ncbi:MAG TPA: cytochrome-c peroxidase, partial [Polyangiaceae bacterium]
MSISALRLGALMLLAASGCAGPGPVTGSSAGARLDSNLKWEAMNGSSLTLGSLAESGAKSPRLLVLRIVAGWCGTCRWSASHTNTLTAGTTSERVRVLDLLIKGDTNAPATRTDLERWQEASDGVSEVAGDPKFQLSALFEARSALPLFAFVDTRSLTLLGTLSHPTPDAVAEAIRANLARMAGEPAPVQLASELHDGRFTSEEWDMIQAMALPAAALPDPSNALADNSDAGRLGEQLFFDPRLSPGGVSCASCHVPDLVFTDGKETPPEGRGSLDRNAPSILLASDQPRQFWDGRADSLWMQALAPFESPAEFGSSRLFVLRQVFKYYRADYEALFGSLAAFEAPSRFPETGGPGDTAWEVLAADDRGFVTRAFVNVGKAIA